MALLELRGVTRMSPEGERLVSDLDLRVEDGELLTVVGPSGSGKTTLLRLIAGLEELDAGEILLDGERIDGLPAAHRNVAMVFQDDALYHHLTAGRNLEFPLRLRGMEAEVRDDEVDREARAFGIRRILDRKPGELSAGYQQRVATGRAMIRQAALLLLDEPLARLDARAKLGLRRELDRVRAEAGVTVVYVTNDQSEAMAIGDRVAVVSRGVLQQVDRPKHLYDHPATLFVARFIGSPPMNVLPADPFADGDDLVLRIGDDHLRVEGGVHEGVERYVGDGVLVGIRPERLAVAGPDAPFHHCLHPRVVALEDLGADTILHTELREGRELVAKVPSPVHVSAGNRLELLVDIHHLHFFDPHDGRSVG